MSSAAIFLHVDFLAVDQTQRISVEVPIVMEGESPVVTAREGILITGRSSLTLGSFPERHPRPHSD